MAGRIRWWINGGDGLQNVECGFSKIEAKYQHLSGTGRRSGYMSESDLLGLFIFNKQVPADMHGRLKTFVPQFRDQI
jgi:hypothetical protein